MNFGGRVAEVIKLVGADPTAWDPSILDTPILMASADVEGAAGNRYYLAASADPSVYPMILRKAAAERAVYYLWKQHRSGQPMPEEIRQILDTSNAALTLIANSKQGAGNQKEPQRRIHAVTDVDLTDGGRIPRMTLRGWERL